LNSKISLKQNENKKYLKNKKDRETLEEFLFIPMILKAQKTQTFLQENLNPKESRIFKNLRRNK